MGIIGYGSTADAITEARDRLRAQGIETSSMRLRSLPLNDDVRTFMEGYDQIYVVELNQDSQMLQLLCAHAPKDAAKLAPVNLCDGLPLTATFITQRINAHRTSVKH